jgi:hypothetical protein
VNTDDTGAPRRARTRVARRCNMRRFKMRPASAGTAKPRSPCGDRGSGSVAGARIGRWSEPSRCRFPPRSPRGEGSDDADATRPCGSRSPFVRASATMLRAHGDRLRSDADPSSVRGEANAPGDRLRNGGVGVRDGLIDVDRFARSRAVVGACPSRLLRAGPLRPLSLVGGSAHLRGDRFASGRLRDRGVARRGSHERFGGASCCAPPRDRNRRVPLRLPAVLRSRRLPMSVPHKHEAPAGKCWRGLRNSELRGQDLNLRPSGYEPDELPGCSTPRQVGRS